MFVIHSLLVRYKVEVCQVHTWNNKKTVLCYYFYPDHLKESILPNLLLKITKHQVNLVIAERFTKNMMV